MSFLFIKRRVYDINILLIEPVDRLSQPLAEALIVDYLALAEITYDVVYIRVVAETQDIVIGQSSFLFGLRSAMTSPVTAIVAALHGVPEANCGYTPAVWSTK